MGFATFVIGRGMVDSEVLAVERAVSEYDERLYFDRNLDTGQFCVYLKTIPQEPDLPLIGFDRIPTPDVVVKRLWQADTLRHGEQILDDMRRRNEQYKQPLKRRVEDAEGQTAEALEWGHRKVGTHPSPQTFIPKEVTSGVSSPDAGPRDRAVLA